MSTDLGPRRSSGRVKHASAAAVESITVSSSIPAPPSGRSLRPRRSSAGIYSLPSDPDSDSDEYVDTPESFEPSEPRPERGTGTGKSLRPRAALSAPVGLNDYIATDRAFSSRKKSKHKQKQKPKRAPPGDACQHCRDSRKKCDRRKPRCGACVKAKQQCVVRKEEDKGEEVEEVSVRAEIRKSLEETKKKRDAFYVKYRDLFEPLLPEKNYISKMIEKMGEKTMEEEEEEEEEAMGVATVQIEVRDGGNKKPEETQSVTVATAVEATQPVAAAKEVVPYKLLEHQPEHVKATMKPYQLSGLSFLVWLYNNGASGILGDEMGLGKTLVSFLISLFVYLVAAHD
jgi:hypothetical protein